MGKISTENSTKTSVRYGGNIGKIIMVDLGIAIRIQK